ncbi:ABC transporter permease [Devosia sp. 66-22]|jgi:simple sugar transport system permease protein|uniref:ABC transporter permease n=1 Tax=Devosia sp. 66-22 TaxID=1895753 RepID=UPI0009296112|nr:ABC transporter permease [Devosia sp. 66-22]OJX51949.1 MAG: sugar ABC transporter permease [Devosia sp. 66-22]
MQLRLEKRSQPSQLLRVVTPIAAVLLTMVLGAIVFTLLGYDGVGAVREIFISPLVNSYKWQDLAVKAAPLIIIAVGLAISYRANVWNIGAEGQYIIGAVVGTGVGLATNSMTGWWIMPLMMLAGAAGGAAYAAVPAFLRVRFRVNEILTTLMLTYVSVYVLNYLVFGPWKSPTSMGQPQTVMFSADQSLPYIIPGTIVQLNAPIAIVVALVAWLVFSRFVFGFQIRVVGAAPHAARYGGFSADRTVWLALLISGGLAGFAGVLEAMGPFGRLVPQFPTNYGFTAIIVAFLGRLHPIGVILAGLIVALSFVGGEMAQISIKLPFAAVGIFQAMMLFLLLASDLLVRYRLRVVRPGEVPA